MVIKQATTLDIDPFYELFSEIMHEGYAGYSPELINHFLAKDYSKGQFYLWLERFFRNIYLAIDSGKIVGFIIGDYTYGGVGFVSWLGVSQSHRKSGVGTALYREYENFAIKRNAHLIELYTYPAVALFYFKLGFKQVGEREQGYFGQKNLIMNKKIGNWSDENLPSP